VTCSTWNVNISPFTIKGSIQLLTTEQGKDSLIAWSETEAYVMITICNNIQDRLIIDSIRIYTDNGKTLIESYVGVDTGYLGQYRNSYFVSGEEKVDLRLSIRDIKGNQKFLHAIMAGEQSVVFFTYRGSWSERIKLFRLLTTEGQVIKEIEASPER